MCSSIKIYLAEKRRERKSGRKKKREGKTRVGSVKERRKQVKEWEVFFMGNEGKNEKVKEATFNDR